MKTLVFLLALVACVPVYAQNLVPNPSMELLEEDCDSLQCCFNVGSRPLYWYSWQNSPDYFNACAPGTGLDSLVDVPQNGMAFQYAADGQAYVGFYAYQPTDEFRECVGVELIEPLTPGMTYEVSFKLNLAWAGNYWGGSDGGCNNVGALFSVSSNAWLGINGPGFDFRNYAHVYSSAILTDTADWTLVSGTFTADSSYQYLVLGNFFDNENTVVVPIPPPGAVGAVYVLVDQVCVAPVGHSCEITSVAEAVEEGSNVYWDPGTQEFVVEYQEVQEFTVTLSDASGRLILSPVHAIGDRARLNGRGLAVGVYVLAITEAQGRRKSKSIAVR